MLCLVRDEHRDRIFALTFYSLNKSSEKWSMKQCLCTASKVISLGEENLHPLELLHATCRVALLGVLGVELRVPANHQIDNIDQTRRK